MRRTHLGTRAWSASLVVGSILGTMGIAMPSGAFEFFDERLVIHGAFEQQIRALGRDMSTSDDVDLAQWYSVFSLEAEYMAAPDGWGPFDLLTFFSRVEARYDCIYSRGCGMFGSVDAFGDRANHLPARLVDGERSGFQGTVFVDDLGSYAGRIVEAEEDPRNGFGRAVFGTTNDRAPLLFSQLHRIDGLFEIAGPDQDFGAGQGAAGADDPAFFYFREVLDNCRFGSREVRGGDNGHGVQILGPINPKCRIETTGRLRNLPNPFRMDDISPITGSGGTSELPYRPAPVFGFDEPAARSAAQGVYYPSPGFRRALDSGNLGDFDQNFRQAELEWNRGASQQDEGELKEVYADIEMFDSRLWLRLGKQNIVWGKTELFRTTDQFNPPDLALATLPELEESRIPLWAVRGVWSFWEVGPFEDMRLEVAANFDQFEPADLGRCGEPFTVFAACSKTAGLFFHGITGFGLAGERRPQDPWNDVQGVEVGARLEFRLGRFSFQVMDFYGFEDRPYADRIYEYERNVDPLSGRPRRMNLRGPCVDGTEPACFSLTSNILPDGSVPNTGGDDSVVDPDSRQDSLDNQSTNLQLFTMICSTSIGFNAIDSSACGQTVFNSLNNPLSRQPVDRADAKNPASGLTVSGLLSNSLAGNTLAGGQILPLLIRKPTGETVPPPFVRLNTDPCDSFQTDGCPDKGDAPVSDYGGHPFFATGGPTLNEVLTDEQEALLGCGAFYGTDCEVDGIDLANTEASVLMQSVVGFPGNTLDEWLTTNGLPQPGTVDFDGGPVATRVREDGTVASLPGALGPGDSGYDLRIDGCVDPSAPGCGGARLLAIPTTDVLGNPLPDGGFGASAGQAFTSEMAALSFNFQILAAALSSPPDLAPPALFPDQCPPGAVDCLDVQPDEFDATDPFSTDPEQCSWAQPQFCGVLGSFFVVVGLQRNSVEAAGNGSFGRNDFIWHSGGEAVLRYEKRNVLGFSMDFAEDITKSNISIETAWIEGQRFTDVNERDGISESDTINLTVSIDRPTFINFLNDQRTFFINTQWFFQYLPGYRSGFTSNGPLNVLATLSVNTGYYQDRLQPAVTFVYDKRSNSGAALPRVAYRFSSNFSATVGMNFFWGRFENRNQPVVPISSVDTQVGNRAYSQGVENGLALVRDRDELYLRIRYTF